MTEVANACTRAFDRLLDPLRPILTVRIDLEHVAIRRDELAVTKVTLSDAESRREVFFLSDVDDAGRILYAGVMRDIDAAFIELDERYLTRIGPMRSAHLTHAMLHAYNHRDWDAYVATLSPDLATADHLLATGKPLHGPAELVEYVQAFIELIPDVRSDVIAPVVVEDRGGVAHIREHGTDAVGGGPVEIEYVSVGIVGPDDRFQWFEVFPPESVDLAVARYRELTAAQAHTP